MKQNNFIRVLCVALCAAVFLGTFTILFSAVDAAGEPTETEASVEAAVGETAAEAGVLNEEISAAAPEDAGLFRKANDWLFGTFGFIGFILDPYQFTIINQRPVFQYLLGFNDLYDKFTWVMNVWADTMIFRIPQHNGKDWRIQLWKGGYGIFLATGGEIGIYEKKQGSKIEHYICPLSQDDWLDLKMTIYNRGKKLFTRPGSAPGVNGLVSDVGPYWWCPGYKILSICTDFYKGPRKNVVMDATLELHEGMVEEFCKQLVAKGFTQLQPGDKMDKDTTETFMLTGEEATKREKTPSCCKRVPVRLVWRDRSE